MRTAIERYIPEGSTVIRHKTAPAVVYAYQRGETILAVGYAGKAKRPTFHHRFRSPEARAKFCARWFESQTNAQQWRDRRAAEKRERLAKPHDIQVGDVFRASWGYEQTNIDFYEIVALHGARTVTVREIAQRSETTGGMIGDCVPDVGNYIGKPMRRRISEFGQITVDSVRVASKIEPLATVDGTRIYAPSHWTAYS